MTVLHAPPPAHEAAFRAQLRGVQLALAGLLAGGLVAAGAPLWAPAPLLLALADRRVRPWLWTARGRSLTLADALRVDGASPPDPLPLSDVLAATAWRRGQPVNDEVHVVLWTADRAWHLTALSPPGAAAADLDDIERRLGGQPGWERALAPADAHAAGTFADPDGALLRHLEASLPAGVWGRLAARGWRADGAAPDPAGLLSTPHDGLLWVDAANWRWADLSGPLTVRSVHGDVRRQAVRTRARGALAPLDVDVLIIGLAGGLSLVLPTPAAVNAPRGHAPADAVTVHTVEAAPIVLRLLDHDPDGLLAPLLAPAVL